MQASLLGAARRVAAVRLSAWTWARVSGVTQTWSPGKASRQTKPCLQAPGCALAREIRQKTEASRISRNLGRRRGICVPFMDHVGWMARTGFARASQISMSQEELGTLPA